LAQIFDFGLIFWALIFILFLYPQVRYQMLQNARLSLIRKLERKLGARVVVMIHRQERITLFGIPFYRYIDIEDSEKVLRAIRSTPKDTPLVLILHTPGGLVLASAQIALAVKAHPAKKTVIVPHYAMSGGTLIALAADEIVMDPHAVLGPVDPQLTDPHGGTVPAVSVVRAVSEKGRARVDDETLIRADVAAKAIRQMKELLIELTEDRLGREGAERLAEELVSGRYTHDYPLTPNKLREMGIEVRTEVPEEAYDLMALYPQAAQAKPGVEFIPGPYVPPRRGEAT
jgi:ClpP class serine protease